MAKPPEIGGCCRGEIKKYILPRHEPPEMEVFLWFVACSIADKSKKLHCTFTREGCHFSSFESLYSRALERGEMNDEINTLQKERKMSKVSVRLFGLFQLVCGAIILVGTCIVCGPLLIGPNVLSIVMLFISMVCVLVGMFAVGVGAKECLEGVSQFSPKERLESLGMAVVMALILAGYTTVVILLFAVLPTSDTPSTSPSYEYIAPFIW